MVQFGYSYSEDSIYYDHIRLMESCWGINSYLNSKQIKICDVGIMIIVFGSSGSFG